MNSVTHPSTRGYLLGSTSAIDQALASPPGADHRCPFGGLLDNLDADYSAKVEQAIAMIVEHRRTHGRSPKGPTSSWLSGIIEADGHGRWRHDLISDHIAGRCTCRG